MSMFQCVGSAGQEAGASPIVCSNHCQSPWNQVADRVIPFSERLRPTRPPEREVIGFGESLLQLFPELPQWIKDSFQDYDSPIRRKYTEIFKNLGEQQRKETGNEKKKRLEENAMEKTVFNPKWKCLVEKVKKKSDEDGHGHHHHGHAHHDEDNKEREEEKTTEEEEPVINTYEIGRIGRVFFRLHHRSSIQSPDTKYYKLARYMFRQNCCLEVGDENKSVAEEVDLLLDEDIIDERLKCEELFELQLMDDDEPVEHPLSVDEIMSIRCLMRPMCREQIGLAYASYNHCKFGLIHRHAIRGLFKLCRQRHDFESIYGVIENEIDGNESLDDEETGLVCRGWMVGYKENVNKKSTILIVTEDEDLKSEEEQEREIDFLAADVSSFCDGLNVLETMLIAPFVSASASRYSEAMETGVQICCMNVTSVWFEHSVYDLKFLDHTKIDRDQLVSKLQTKKKLNIKRVDIKPPRYRDHGDEIQFEEFKLKIYEGKQKMKLYSDLGRATKVFSELGRIRVVNNVNLKLNNPHWRMREVVETESFVIEALVPSEPFLDQLVNESKEVFKVIEEVLYDELTLHPESCEPWICESRACRTRHMMGIECIHCGRSRVGFGSFRTYNDDDAYARARRHQEIRKPSVKIVDSLRNAYRRWVTSDAPEKYRFRPRRRGRYEGELKQEEEARQKRETEKRKFLKKSVEDWHTERKQHRRRIMEGVPPLSEEDEKTKTEMFETFKMALDEFLYTHRGDRTRYNRARNALLHFNDEVLWEHLRATDEETRERLRNTHLGPGAKLFQFFNDENGEFQDGFALMMFIGFTQHRNKHEWWLEFQWNDYSIHLLKDVICKIETLFDEDDR